MKTLQERAKLVAAALDFTQETPIAADSQERSLLSCYVQGSLTIDEVIKLLEDNKQSSLPSFRPPPLPPPPGYLFPLAPAIMSPPTDFLTRVLTSTLPGQVAKRFAFADGEVGIVYTRGWDFATSALCNMLLVVATFPPRQDGDTHYFGLVSTHMCVASAAEAADLLAQFTLVQATAYRASCQ